MSAGIDRLAGLARRDGRRPAWPTTPWCYGDFTIASGAVAARELLARYPDVDAIFIASDLMAAGALGVLAEHGKEVPGDVAVVGYDNLGVAASTTPPLTSVIQPVVAMARAAGARLLDAAAGRHRCRRAADLRARAGHPRLGLTARRRSRGPVGPRRALASPRPAAARARTGAACGSRPARADRQQLPRTAGEHRPVQHGDLTDAVRRGAPQAGGDPTTRTRPRTAPVRDPRGERLVRLGRPRGSRHGDAGGRAACRTRVDVAGRGAVADPDGQQRGPAGSAARSPRRAARSGRARRPNTSARRAVVVGEAHASQPASSCGHLGRVCHEPICAT